MIEQTNNSELVKEQKLPENENLDLLTGLPFVITEENDTTDEEKAEKIKEYFAGLNDVEKTKIYTEILSEPTDEEIEQMTSMYMNNFSSRDAIITLVASTMGMRLSAVEKAGFALILMRTCCRLRAGTGTSDAGECD